MGPAETGGDTALHRKPNLHIKLLEHDHNYVADLILRGDLHLGLVPSTQLPEGISWEFLRSEEDAPVRLVVNRGHRLATLEAIGDISELAREHFVLPSPKDHPALLSVREYFREQGFVPKVSVMTSAGTALALVAASTSLVTIQAGFRSQTLVERGLAVVDLPGEGCGLPMFLIWRTPRLRTESARLVADLLRAQLKERVAGSRPPAEDRLFRMLTNDHSRKPLLVPGFTHPKPQKTQKIE